MYRRSSEELRKMAFTELNLCDHSERGSWLQHPCTRSLLHTLQGDIVEMLDMWSNGNYTTETTDGTIQLNAEALGQYKSASNVLEFIEGINDEEMFDHDKPEWA